MDSITLTLDGIVREMSDSQQQNVRYFIQEILLGNSIFFKDEQL